MYQPTSSYGHFGRSELTWENTARSKKLAADLLGSSPKSASKSNGAEAAPAKKAPAKKAKPQARA